MYLLLRSSFHSYVCKGHSVHVIMKLLPQLYVLHTFGTCHYEALSTALCATDILYLSLWCSCYSFLCYWHSVPVIMMLLSQICVLLKFCTSHYEAPSTALCATDIVCQALRSSFHSSVCFWLSVPVIMKLLPQFYVLMTCFTCYFEAPSTALSATDIL